MLGAETLRRVLIAVGIASRLARYPRTAESPLKSGIPAAVRAPHGGRKQLDRTVVFEFLGGIYDSARAHVPTRTRVRHPVPRAWWCHGGAELVLAAFGGGFEDHLATFEAVRRWPR